MNGDPKPTSALVCCGVFEAEVRELVKAHWPELAIRFQSSMLHMEPERLGASLESLVDEELAMGRRVVLVYGDCYARMAALEARPGVVRTRGSNCCEMLLGRDEYRRLSREGAFFLLPEWTRRWREIFATRLGLDHDNATSLMRDMHTKLVYLDTGLVPVPESDLAACADYCGLPYEVRPASLEPLRAAVQESLDRLGTTEPPP
jgi:hypothetical protein